MALFFSLTTFGESHGPAIGVIVQGVPPGLEIEEKDIQKEMDRRKPGQSSVTTPRKESDIVHIYSGVFEGKTTGTPIGILLYNQNHRPQDYTALKDIFRPGHADFTYTKKYTLRDWRGSGRASGRETAARVAAGAIAKKILARRSITITAYTKAVGPINCEECDLSVIEKNPLRACDMKAAEKMRSYVENLKEKSDSIGGIVECRVDGLPAGVGEPVFDKLEACLSHGMMSIGAVKGIEFGTGFEAARLKGSEQNDEMNSEGFITNNAGGTLGGISTGQILIFRIAVRAPSSIAKEQKTVDIKGREHTINIEGRHDPCICPRIVPVVEAMTAISVEDLIQRQQSSIRLNNIWKVK